MGWLFSVYIYAVYITYSPVKLCGNPKQIATQMLFAFLYKVNIQI